MKKISAVLISLILLVGVLLLPGCGHLKRRTNARNLTEYTIDAVYSEQDHTVRADMSVSYLNAEHVALNEVAFNLHPNGFREDAKFFAVAVGETNVAFPSGVSYGGITVEEVNYEFEIGGEDNNLMTVELTEPLLPNERVEINMKFSVKLANVRHRLGYTAKAVNLGNWYPVAAVYENGGFKSYPYYCLGDPFYSEAANYKVTMTLPKGYTVASSGVLKDTRETETEVRREYELGSARDFALVLSKEFKCLSKRVNNVDLYYYYIDDQNSAENLSVAADALAWYSEKFYDYPYETYSVVQTDFLQGGMEYPALVYISRNLSVASVKDVIAHETAHQWWYGIVGNNQVEHAYLDEGLTELSTAMFFDANRQYGRTMAEFERRASVGYRGYLAMIDKLSVRENTVMTRSLKDFSGSPEYVAITYDKGFILFEDLKKQAGEAKFGAALKEYCAEAEFDVATIDCFIAALKNQTGVDYTSFVSGYLDGRVHIG